jgi:hypothetical protein
MEGQMRLFIAPVADAISSSAARTDAASAPASVGDRPQSPCIFAPAPVPNRGSDSRQARAAHGLGHRLGFYQEDRSPFDARPFTTSATKVTKNHCDASCASVAR